MHLFEIVLEFVNIFYTCAAPCVNGLVIIANDKHLVPVTGKKPYQCILDGIGILKLINEYMFEPVLIMLEQGIVIAQKFERS